MSEIKRKLLKLDEGKSHTSQVEEYVITEDHSLCDVLRFVIDEIGVEESKYLLTTI
ncbi:MAG: hypothetical protein V3V84_07765 [Candidatus Bathyarchaeia archaeon]